MVKLSDISLSGTRSVTQTAQVIIREPMKGVCYYSLLSMCTPHETGHIFALTISNRGLFSNCTSGEGGGGRDLVDVYSFPNRERRGRAFAHGAMGRRIDPSWGGPTDLFLVPASAPRLV